MARHWVPFAGATLTAVVCVAVGLFFDLSPTDDAFITYRCSENFALGHGLVFNPGEPVEATSNFLFAIILGLLYMAGIEPVLGAILVNVASLWTIAFLLIFDSSRRLAHSRARAWSWTSGLLLLVFSPSFIYYVWVGLETVFYSALLFAGCLFFLRQPRSLLRFGLAGIFFGLAAITRMEAVIVLPVIAILLLVGCGFKEMLVKGIVLGAGFAVVFIPVLSFRLSFYGFPFPNAYYVKVDGGTVALILRGLQYVSNFVEVYPGLVVVAALSIVRFVFARADRFRTGFITLTILAQTSYVIIVGGDFFPFYRFMVPVLALFALGFADICSFGIGRGPLKDISNEMPRKAAVPILIAIAFAIASGGGTLLHWEEYGAIASQQGSAAKRIKVGRLLRRNTPKDTTLLLGAVGAIPYYSKLRSYDYFGLTDPIVAHKRARLGKGKPGHEKTDINQINRLRPDLIMYSSWFNKETSLKKSVARQVGFYLNGEDKLNEEKREANYIPMRVSNRGVTAIVAVKKGFELRLGAKFERIISLRIRALRIPRFLGKEVARTEHLTIGTYEVQSSLYPVLSQEIAESAGYPDWYLYPPPNAITKTPSALECHVRNLPQVPVICSQILFPFSVFAIFPPRHGIDEGLSIGPLEPSYGAATQETGRTSKSITS
ncbi:MAG: hypothetical protein GY847_25310 [Proteobacteria bacterium]|nr:hypothetical protein [Pseudomonadota bacterium]